MSYSIIIPSRNIDNLTACVRALREAGETGRVIVVWDDETSTRHVFFSNRLPSGIGLCGVVRGAKPFCFAQNCNIGIGAAGEDDVVLLNDDVMLRDDNFHAIREGSQGGICAATMHVTGYPAQRQQVGINARAFREVAFVNFAAVYIPRSTIALVGLLDERFGGPGVYGGEDVDYCLRVREAGLKVGVSDFCFVDHSKLPSTFRGAHPTNSAPGDITESNRIGIEKWGTKWPHGRHA